MPVLEETCALGASLALTHDTGLIDARFVGLSSLKRFQFRRTTTCSPFKADDGFASLKKACPWKDDFADEISHHLADFTANEPYKKTLHLGQHRFIPFLGYDDGHIDSDPKSVQYGRIMAEYVYSTIPLRDLTRSSYANSFLIYSKGLIYDKYR